jgi:hypothetical protein
LSHDASAIGSRPVLKPTFGCTVLLDERFTSFPRSGFQILVGHGQDVIV